MASFCHLCLKKGPHRLSDDLVTGQNRLLARTDYWTEQITGLNTALARAGSCLNRPIQAVVLGFDRSGPGSQARDPPKSPLREAFFALRLDIPRPGEVAGLRVEAAVT